MGFMEEESEGESKLKESKKKNPNNSLLKGWTAPLDKFSS